MRVATEDVFAQPRSTSLLLRAFTALVAVLCTACATVPGSDYPKSVSVAFDAPGTTQLGRQLGSAAARHSGLSGFRLLADGSDGLLLRVQMLRTAERSIDVQYFMFAEDDTGKLLQQGILRAADRGVRVRILVDDTNSFDPPRWKASLSTLNGHPRVEIRVFNPFAYRGEAPALHFIDAALNAPRANRRMHNKLLVVDNALAIVGGRNIADSYYGSGTRPVPLFGIPLGESPIRFGDFDVAAAGPIVPQLSQTFDAYWNSALSIPRQALETVDTAPDTLAEARAALDAKIPEAELRDIERRVKGDPLAGLLSGRLAWTWSRATVVVDPPEKAQATPGQPIESPIAQALVGSIRDARRELVIVTPYFVPGERVLGVLEDARRRNVRVRILTNSLASTDVPMVHSGYRKYRKPLIESGAELYEIRAVPSQLPADSRARHGSPVSGSGSDAPFALHAKLYVYDVQRVFIGSANFDRRSFKVNTELGLMIESPEIARQIVDRFDRFASLGNSYRLVMERDGPFGPRVRWRTEQDGAIVDLDDDPQTTVWRRAEVDLYSMLPIEELL